MSTVFRGGNSRLLAKLLDQFTNPLAVLDRRGVIVFVNKALCELTQTDASQIAGQQTLWHIAADSQPLGPLLNVLAAPAGVLQGRVIARQLIAPVAFGSNCDSQLFVPVLDPAGDVEGTFVAFGSWPTIQSQLSRLGERADRQRDAETILAGMRSRWKRLDSLTTLLGTSPEIKLAMTRVQMAVDQDCNLFISGPKGVGKSDVHRAVFMQRLKKRGLAETDGQLFPIGCELLDDQALASSLDVFSGRLPGGKASIAQCLLLENIDKLSSTALLQVLEHLDKHGRHSVTLATSHTPADLLSGRNAEWKKLVCQLAALDVQLPGLSARREDIPTLANHFLALECHRQERALLTISREAERLMVAYSWPGNTSQLRAAIEQSVAHAELTKSIQVAHLPAAMRTFAGAVHSEQTATGHVPQKAAATKIGTLDAGQFDTIEQGTWRGIEPIDLDAVLLELERTMMQRALKLSPRNRAGAARLLGISRPRLLRRIEQLGLDSDA